MKVDEKQTKNALNRTAGFMKRHPIIYNLLLMALVGWGVIWIALIALDFWTDHGSTEVVPDMKGMSYPQAIQALEVAGLRPELSDSLYDNSVPPGTVLEQSPRANTKVKPNRTVYLTITAFSPKMVTLPSVADLSLRQARTTLEGIGLRNIREVSVPSEYKDLVMGVRYNGVPVRPGARIPTSAIITLEVGSGITMDADSTATADAAENDKDANVLDLE